MSRMLDWSNPKKVVIQGNRLFWRCYKCSTPFWKWLNETALCCGCNMAFCEEHIKRIEFWGKEFCLDCFSLFIDSGDTIVE